MVSPITKLKEQAVSLAETSGFTKKELKLVLFRIEHSNESQLKQFIIGEEPKGWPEISFDSLPNIETDDSETDDSETDDSETDDSETDDSETDDSEIPDSEIPDPDDSENPETDNSKEQSEIHKDIDKFSKILDSNPDAQEFMSMCMLTGNVKDPRVMDDYQKSDWLQNYYSWLAGGKQKPKMPNLEPEKLIIPTTFYRLLDRTKDMMFWLDQNGTKHGVKETKVFVEQKHPLTGKVVNSHIPTGEIKKEFVLKFSTSEYDKLLAKGQELHPPNVKMRFYIMRGRVPHVVKSKDFGLKSFDDLFAKVIDTKYIV